MKILILLTVLCSCATKPLEIEELNHKEAADMIKVFENSEDSKK